MSLSVLPTETLSLILEFLADEDLATLLVAQRVCKRFQAAIQHILEHYSAETEYTGQRDAAEAVHPLLWQHFSQIIDTVAADSDSSRRITDINTPFYRLPWVKRRTPADAEGEGEERRGERTGPRNRHVRGIPHLRPEASWRRLSLTWGIDPGIKRLDIVHKLTVYRGTGLDYAQLEIPSMATSGGEGEGEGEGEGMLTMGLFYDLMASGVGHMGGATMNWQLLVGCRLSSYDNWCMMRSRNPYPKNDAITNLFVPEEGSAVLYVTGFRGCTMGGIFLRKKTEDVDDLVWDPKAIGGLPIVSCPWQGPDHDWDTVELSGDEIEDDSEEDNEQDSEEDSEEEEDVRMA
ncbi:hypothetical protein ABKA04_006566 [Annulohypoxylon sp. FPYF3050]